MKKLKITIAKIGESKYSNIYKFINRLAEINKSEIFVINSILKINPQKLDDIEQTSERLIGNHNNLIGFNDKTLLKMLCEIDDDSDFIIAITDFPITNNYFARRLSNRISVMSLYEVNEILSTHNIPIQNYILLNIYTYSTIYTIFKNLQPNNDNLFHQETRGCLFDHTDYKEDLVLSTVQPCLCNNCKIKFSSNTYEPNYFKILNREIKRIKKSKFYTIIDWIKMYPIISLFITALLTIILNIISNYLSKLLYF